MSNDIDRAIEECRGDEWGQYPESVEAGILAAEVISLRAQKAILLEVLEAAKSFRIGESTAQPLFEAVDRARQAGIGE